MSQHPLRLLLDFDERIQRDRDQSPAFLHRRDRRFALDCQARGDQPDAATWLAHMDRLSGPGTRNDAATRTLRQWRRINSGFALTGALFGVFTMSGLLFFEGASRINVTLFLAFVALQNLLALATTTQSLAGWQPWRWLLRRLNLQPGSPAIAPLHPLMMARAAHLGGSTFALTGLMTLLVMLVVQDLAFGWSTTLDTAAARYHAVVSALATPWQSLWPAAAPSLELIEATRFFRAAPGASGIDPAQWGHWWPFIVMLWTTWVFLPRLLLLAFSHWALHHKARQLLTRHPGMQTLHYRMETPTLDTGNQHNDAHDLPDTRTRSHPETLPDSRQLIQWAGAGEPELPTLLSEPQTLRFRAGGRATLADDERVLQSIGNALTEEPSPVVLLVTRSWEPPTGELFDFLEQAKAQWPDSTQVAILPLATNASEQPAAHLLQPWLRFAERLPAGFARIVRIPEAPDTQRVGEGGAL
ncbi:DUF2868 domain-containing protein [Marinobacter daepoensis]|uniref:DUF2868 domain-containing protein n=1 Tax=Marinobacter daepoensis TaxID=262077 RepID=UPI001C944716|nr:DUF2868 domain-containing protein [Marinobacter daepoensis]MBY6032688.1 DUF2868 domain-containing protein [Marinobacter daepoensis]